MKFRFAFLLFTVFFASGLLGQSNDSEEFSQMALLNSDQILKIGDRLLYSVVEDRTQPRIVFVDSSGSVEIPLIGDVKATGKTCRDFAYEIKEILEVDYYHHATVLVQPHNDANSRGRFILLGPVQNQGPQMIPADEILTVANAILRSGGFLQGADPSRVTVIRIDPGNVDKEKRIVVDVTAILESGDFDQDVAIEPNDRILVPRRDTEGGQFYIWGDGINKPGLYNIPPEGNFTVSKAVLLAGGFTPYADKIKVELTRSGVEVGEEERRLLVNVGEILEDGIRDFDPLIQPDDIIRVKERTVIFFK